MDQALRRSKESAPLAVVEAKIAGLSAFFEESFLWCEENGSALCVSVILYELRMTKVLMHF